MIKFKNLASILDSALNNDHHITCGDHYLLEKRKKDFLAINLKTLKFCNYKLNINEPIFVSKVFKKERN